MPDGRARRPGRRVAGRCPEAAALRLPAAWRGFLAEVFGASVGARGDVALEFGVTFQTACNWCAGRGCPAAGALLHGQRRFPTAFVRHVLEVA